MTHKEKAEQYVREKCPELMELSFGCWVTPIAGNGTVAKIFKVYEDDTFDALIEAETEDALATITLTKAKLENVEIIGHPIQLQHWLKVLNEAVGTRNADRLGYHSNYVTLFIKDVHILFSLTTGQPATEGDYQEFCKIAGI